MKGLLAFLILTPLLLSAQERCATNYIQANQAWMEETDQFEDWLLESKIDKRILQSFSRYGQVSVEYTLPVVFHVIHGGETIGEGKNIPTEKILEQLEILNNDFRRLNEDTSSTPSVFLPVAADTEINFVLAKQDPEGLPTTGIVRKQGSKAQYSSNFDDQLLKSESYWPAEDYLNIWIADLTGGFLGYAQYPFANLPGIENEFKNYRLTDGLVLDYVWVGVNVDAPSFESYGRTATHEMGHYLGLRHIWGDGGCATDDFCEDTPPASGSYSGKSPPCEFPDDQRQCTDEAPMFQNYMDYTDDACMNLFTLDQKERMRLILEYSPRRNSLLSSPGLSDPIQFANDLGVRTILSPSIEDCSSEISPSITIRNYGSNTITSYSVGFYVNDFLVETINGSVNLSPLDIQIVNFSPIATNAGISNTLRFQVLSVNGVADQNQGNNHQTIVITPNESIIPPFFENFEGVLEVTTISEFGTASNWEVTTAPKYNALNKAAYLDLHNSQTNIGSLDLLLTKVIDLSSLSTALLTFQYAYAPRSDSTFLDGLIVAVSTNCGAFFSTGSYLFEEYGMGLGTTFPRSQEYVPIGPSDWEEVLLNLTPYAGNESVQVAFIGVNGGGNNLYLDSIGINSDNLLDYDIGIREVSNLSDVSCEQDIFPTLELKNYGSETVDQVVISFESESSIQHFDFNNLNLSSGASMFVTLQGTLEPGVNRAHFELISVNQRNDEYAANNVQTFYLYLNEDEESIPVRQNFESDPWIITEKSNNPLFENTLLDQNTVLMADAFGATLTGTETWLVSPIMNTNQYTEAALRFRVSYAERPPFIDNLRIYLSTNCGISYDEIIYDKNSDSLAIRASSQEWVPTSDEDWRMEYISLTEILQLTQEEKVSSFRIAFVFTNGTGNNLYLDDIEVLTTDDPDLIPFESTAVLFPNPVTRETGSYFNLGFNLERKEDLRIQIIDLSGKLIADIQYPETLNQVYTIEAPGQSGFYFVRIFGKSFVETKRLFISR